MGNRLEPSPAEEPEPLSPASVPGWGHPTSIVFRFVFAYGLLYSVQLLLGFPSQLTRMAFSVPRGSAMPTDMPEWLAATLKYLAYPGMWFQQGMDWFTTWISFHFLDVEVVRPARFSGSGDRLYDYCTCFAFLVLALVATLAWSAASELGCHFRTHRRPNYDRMHTLLRAIVRFHLLCQMISYGVAKVWCAQFPPISDAQLDTKYGDSTPMGLLWRFMQFSGSGSTVC